MASGPQTTSLASQALRSVRPGRGQPLGSPGGRLRLPLLLRWAIRPLPDPLPEPPGGGVSACS